LEKEGKSIRVVSMPCVELFEKQGKEYRDQVLPPSVTNRLVVEAGVSFGWDRYSDRMLGIDRFGASAPWQKLAGEFGLTVENVKKHI